MNTNSAQIGIAGSAPRLGEPPRTDARPGNVDRDWIFVASPKKARKGDIATIITIMGALYGVSRAALVGQRRDAPLPLLRHVAFFIARERGHSAPKIGREFNRDHSTVLYGAKIAERAIQAQEGAFDIYCEVRRYLEAV